jgi:uncharacterized protein YndB with AHSA1/START domain
MSDLGSSYRVAAVKFERTLPGPVGRVWQHLTEPPKLEGWFGPGSIIEPRKGGNVSLMMGGHIAGIVTQWLPERRLTYSWNVLAPGETLSVYPESYLTLELASAGNKVMLTLTHLPILERFEKQNAMGWHTFLDVLAATLSGGTVEPRSHYMKQNAEKYGVDLNNLAR